MDRHEAVSFDPRTDQGVFWTIYGGLAGWEGFGALLRFISDKSHFIWVPIHAYLLEHPTEGLVLM